MPNAILSEREPVGGFLTRIGFQVDPELAATHQKHGQYVELRHDGSENVEETVRAAVRGYFVIASPPGQSSWSFLVKEGGSLADRLQSLPLGTELVSSAAQGAGFPYEAARGKPLLLVVTGSGIAAVLSTLGARIADGESRHTYLLYGVRERRDVALSAELDAIRRAGVEVSICLSREHTEEEGFYKGYVQTVAAARGWALAGGLAFAAGVKEMIADMRAAAPSLGLRAEDVRLNH